MQRIDFIGAPGVGKSTLYRALKKGRRRKRWLTPGEARRAAIGGPVLGTPLGYARDLWWRARTVLYGGVTIERLAVEAFLSDGHEWRDYLQFCLEALQRNGRAPELRILHARWFARVVTDVAFIASHTAGRRVVFHDSLSQKVLDVLPCQSLDEELTEKYFQLLPAPHAVVHLNAPPEIVSERVEGRRKRKVAKMHRGVEGDEVRKMSEAAVRMVEIGAEVLRGRGVTVVDVDTSAEMQTARRQIDDFLNAYQTG